MDVRADWISKRLFTAEIQSHRALTVARAIKNPLRRTRAQKVFVLVFLTRAREDRNDSPQENTSITPAIRLGGRRHESSN